MRLPFPFCAWRKARELLYHAQRMERDRAVFIKTPALLSSIGHPPIGQPLENGIYAGLMLHDNAPHALILLPGDDELVWSKAKDWAATQGGELPSRFDALALFKNLKSEFKDDWYWTSEEYAGNAGYAWIQDFTNGDQFSGRKGSVFRCRAVRRVPI